MKCVMMLESMQFYYILFYVCIAFCWTSIKLKQALLLEYFFNTISTSTEGQNVCTFTRQMTDDEDINGSIQELLYYLALCLPLTIVELYGGKTEHSIYLDTKSDL